MASSAAALYDQLLDVEELADAVERGAAQAVAGPTRLRVALVPGGDPETSLATLDSAAVLPVRPVVLAPLALPGGLGAHKWRDRGLLDAAAAGAGGEPLLVEPDGEVLETARGSVLAVEGGALVTPPCDGRILPGVTRAAVLGLARAAGIAVREERLGLDRLRAADELLVTSSIRLVQPAVVARAQAAGPMARRLAALLGARIATAALQEAAHALPGPA